MASPQLELLRCAVAEPETALECWKELVHRFCLDQFDHTSHRLLPAVWVNLKKANRTFPEEGRLRGLHRRTWVQNQRLKGAARNVLELFASKEIPALIFKGLALTELIYRDAGVRPSWDFDLLVPFDRAEEALSELLAQGWVFKGPHQRPSERLEHGTTLCKSQIELDFHWNLLREARRPEQDQIFWQHATTIELDGLRAWTLSPTHQLFYLLAVADREPENRHRYLLDLHALWRVYGEQLDTSEVMRLLRERKLLGRLSQLPLHEVGLGGLQRGLSPNWLDRLWSKSSAHVFDGSHEAYYLAYPFLDYWFHYRGQTKPGWGLGEYLQRRLEVEDLRDFLTRSVHKAFRLLRAACR